MRGCLEDFHQRPCKPLPRYAVVILKSNYQKEPLVSSSFAEWASLRPLAGRSADTEVSSLAEAMKGLQLKWTFELPGRKR